MKCSATVATLMVSAAGGKRGRHIADTLLTEATSDAVAGKKRALTTEATKKGSFGYELDPSSPPHTLILGTQPSDVSLEGRRYYDTHTNAMWHIIGDALGFRRGWLDAKGRAPPASIVPLLLHDEVVKSYHDGEDRHRLHASSVSATTFPSQAFKNCALAALARLTSRGYALWDVVSESERAGSLDGDIKNAVAADVRGLIEQHPSIRRVCLASGGTTATFFKRHFKDWLREDGAFCLRPGDLLSRRLLGSALGRREDCECAGEDRRDRAIEIVVMVPDTA